ncbi:MAG TPA: protoporphyrinogen oxidase [Kofleriaceae bacterium]|jgi:oxygen-dependent protoporphyrinogen oxidase
MKVAVVGGGIGGLTAARALVAAGFDAHVLEASARPGGVVGTSRVAGFAREHAASSFLGNARRGALALCEQLGVAVDRASPRAKRRWIYLDGKLRALPSNPVALARSDLLTWRGKLALLREPLVPRREPGEDESMYAFAARRLGPEAARAIVAPFVTGVFAADAHDISVEAGFPRFAALERDGGLVRGAAVQLRRALLRRARGGSKRPRGLFAPAGGLGTLVDALAASLGPRVHCRARVQRIAPASGGVIVDGERWDACVLAVPAATAAALVVDALPELAAKLDEFERAPVAVVYLGVPEAIGRDGFGFLVAQGEDLRVLGVVFESTVWPERAPAGQALLRCIFGGARDPDAAALGDAELIALARADVAKALGTAFEPTHASVVRWDAGIAQYRLGHKQRVIAAVTAARSHRLALAGADYRGAALNDLCADADTVVSELRSW